MIHAEPKQMSDFPPTTSAQAVVSLRESRVSEPPWRLHECQGLAITIKVP